LTAHARHVAKLTSEQKTVAWTMGALGMLTLGGVLNVGRLIAAPAGPAQVEESESEPEPSEPAVSTEPEVSAEAFTQARGVGVAIVLGTYGGPGEGTVLDIIESTDTNLGELFAQGMAQGMGHERYGHVDPNGFMPASEDAKSTFSVDVDTASYSNTRRYLEDDELPPPDAVRTEELVNYFDYDYPQPPADSAAPFSLVTEVGPCPWAPERRLVHLGIQGYEPPAAAIPPRNLVYLIDVSGSMQAPNKLPLVKHGLATLTERLRAEDRVAIIVYAGGVGMVLEPTPGADRRAILDALDRLEGGGSTNGSAGIEQAYQLAAQSFITGGINRVILATDGDFNVGVVNHDALVELIEHERETGVFLSVLGVGSDNLNDHLMEQLADKGNGNYAYIDGLREARKVLVEEAGSTLVTIAKDVKIQVEFNPTLVERHRLVGYENRVLAHRDFADDSKDAGEIGAGHSVTALYEVELTGKRHDQPLLSLGIRWKQPDGQHSTELSAAAHDRDVALEHTSTDFRFAAAVAAFAARLRGTAQPDYAEILTLARGSLGSDPHCYRHDFLELVWKAGTLAGETLARPDTDCSRVAEVVAEVTPTVEPSSSPAIEPIEDETEVDWSMFVLEVLRLLPPFLALPMFVMAYRQRRRRSRGL
jgi:Ca-activated chloride channel family protein